MAVSIQQASCNALTAYLATKLPGVDIENDWPNPDRVFQNPTLTLLQAGPREDIPMDATILDFSSTGPTSLNTRYQIARCSQPLQMDIWTCDPFTLDDILAKLDDALTDPNVTSGLILTALPEDNWPDTYFDYYFESPDTTDAAFTVRVREYRARVMGSARMMLTVNRATAKQIIQNFNLKLNGIPFP